MEKEFSQKIYSMCNLLSSPLDFTKKEVAIILAAGHGKRIKSQKSKMLHSIWEVPSVERVYNASIAGMPDINTVIVVGIKADDVMSVIGKRDNNQFAYQEVQKGTGHAVQIGLEKISKEHFDGTVYVLPGDMGLLDKETMELFSKNFSESKCDMMVLTGIYDGPIELNNYGRILRVKEFDADSNPSGDDLGKVIEIIEHKDILSVKEDELYCTVYNGRKYNFSKSELIEIREYNSGVYAFRYNKLLELIYTINSNNAQNEIYITDLISLFNQKGYSVSAMSPKEQYVLMGFNDKAVLKEMEKVYRHKIYSSLKNILEIEDPEDFFIDETVLPQIFEMDKKGIPLDIHIGKGVYIGKGVILNYNLTLKKNVYLKGNIVFGENVTIWENAHLSCFDSQRFVIDNNVEILWGDIIKGNIEIGENSRIESSVNMTGSDDFPLRIGKNVLIKGTSYIFGSIIDDDIQIEHSVIINKHVNRLIKKNGEIQKIRFYLPMPSGIDAVEQLTPNTVDNQ